MLLLRIYLFFIMPRHTHYRTFGSLSFSLCLWSHPSLDLIPVYVFPVRWFQFYANWFSAIACANRLSEAISHSSSVIMANIMHIVSKVRI